jgi:excisionase family DNA binding protein
MIFMTEKVEWLSVDQVAQELGVHPDTIRLYIREGTLPAVQLKRSYRINRKDLEDFLRRRYVGKDKDESR